MPAHQAGTLCNATPGKAMAAMFPTAAGWDTPAVLSRLLGPVVLAATLTACPPSASWQTVHKGLPAALLSIWGTSAQHVWAVGADAGDGKGPLVLRFNGSTWEQLSTGTTGDLWWVHGFENGPVYLGGTGGRILRYADGAFTQMSTPSTSGVVFGIWGASPDDLWAVGGAAGGARGAFAWRLVGDAWTVADGFPTELTETAALWKVAGRSANDVWMVGTNGVLVHWDGSTLTPGNAGTGESLFTVAAMPTLSVAVGGFGTGTLLENDGSGWKDVGGPGLSPLVGVAVRDESAYAVGQFGATYMREAGAWHEEASAPQLQESLHAVWIDPEGGVWSVGGQISGLPLTHGVLLHKGVEPIPGGL